MFWIEDLREILEHGETKHGRWLHAALGGGGANRGKNFRRISKINGETGA